MRQELRHASEWTVLLATPDGAARQALRRIYGSDTSNMQLRLRVIRSALQTFIARFGDRPVRVFRAPGRINLRGMHVDTHGGYLNLMTHQRETVMAAAQSENDACVFANSDPRFDEVTFQMGALAPAEFRTERWLDFIGSPAARKRADSRKGHWANYLEGAALQVLYRFPGARIRGICAAVSSDLPQGAALSSSAALVIATLDALLALNGLSLASSERVLSARDAEWYTGARVGVSDQAAEILGDEGTLIHGAVFAKDFDAARLTPLPFPENLRVLVINSFTQRSLSGAQRAQYLQNRVAYSLAIEIARQEMRRLGFPPELASSADRLSGLSPAAMANAGGEAALWRLIAAVPERMPIPELLRRYELPAAQQMFDEYFGGMPERDRPADLCLRGPLLFGIAESERARLFAMHIAEGRGDEAGRLMSVGHDGDRLVDAQGNAYAYDVSGAAIARLTKDRVPIHRCPGAYGASARALDYLVDTALGAGALGASLTGAGIAGSVLALCEANRAENISAALRAAIHSETYTRIRGMDAPIPQGEPAVVVNYAPEGACELIL